MDNEAVVTLDKVRRRDPEAIAELVRLHQQQLRRFVAALCADVGVVDDLAQEVFVRALQRLDCVADLADFGRFLRGIARNVVREQGRWRTRSQERYIAFVDQAYRPGALEAAPAPAAPVSPTLMEALRGCVEKLPARSQRMLHLRYWEELRAAEIGRDLGMNGGAVRIGLLRSREALLACIRSRLGVVLSEALS